MNVLEPKIQTVKPILKFWKTLLIALPVLLLSFLLLSEGIDFENNPIYSISVIIAYLFINTIFILMVYSEKVDKYRSILFVTLSVCFVVAFIPSLIEFRGSIFITPEDAIKGNVSFCHLVTPFMLIPAILNRTIIFPSTMLGGFAPIGTMIVIWLLASLTLGRGFCSWGCFYGGLEDGFSRLLKKPVLKKLNPKWRYFSYAVLLGAALLSLASLSPVYCDWLCPFKAITEFVRIDSIVILIQTVIFLTLFIGLVILLPILTKKRTQCAFLCPFGAFQSFTNKVDPFEIRINQDQCSNCKRCIEICPTFSMDESSIQKGKANLSCTKCGKCIDHCPQKVISLEIKSASSSKKGGIRLFFLYPAFIFLITIGSGFMIDAIFRILLLLTTGKIIQ